MAAIEFHKGSGESLAKFISTLKSKYLFYGVFLANIIFLFSIELYPSSDGAAHLYNSNLIYHLIKGDSEIINTFFVFNTIPVPNWMDHFFLASLRFGFSAPHAEKIFLLIYLVSLTLSFRLLVRQINPTESGLSILIFPFVYSYLFRMGFYNNTFSFVFLFFTLYYWLKTRAQNGLKKYFYFCLLFCLTYFSNGLTFLFLGLVLGLFSASEFFYSKHLAKEQKRTTKDIFKDLFGLFISALPALLLLINFTLNTTLTSFKYSQSTQRSLEELIDWLIDVKPLVAYIPPEEHTYTRPFLYILVVVVIATITGFFFSKKNSNAAAPTRNHYGFLILCAMSISLMLYFVIPDGQGAGMMSDRYCLFFFMFCILWASIQSVPKWLGSFLIIVILFCHFQLLSYQYKKVLIPLSKDASCISKAADHIKDNSLIFTIDLSGNWLQGHYGDYIAIQKPVVVLDSYEAAIGWFPVKWNTTQLPQVQLAGKSAVAGIFWPSNNTAAVKRNIDYVLVYGNNDVLKEVQWAEVNEVLTKNFKLIYAADNYVFLYQMN